MRSTAEGGGGFPDARPSWDDADRVRRFVEMEPDRRLLALLDESSSPAASRVLDLGCAGGRNTEVLVRRGLDVQALDAASAMVAATRARLAPLLGADEAARRVRRGDMRDLSAHADGAFDLVVAIGIFLLAETEADFHRALSEAVRVLEPDGRLLVSNFAPGTGPLGAPFLRVPGTAFLYRKPGEGCFALREPADLDADARALGLVPVVPTRVVERVVDDRRRVTVHALYRN